MTNEQLAKFIQLGGADDLKPVLYDRVKFLLYKFAGQHYSKYKDNYNACGVELADIRQECYGAFSKALEAYKPADKTKFTSYLHYPFKNMANSLLGIRNKDRVNKSILDNCTSLEKPLNTEDENLTLVDALVDETAQSGFENIENKLELEYSVKILNSALDKLEPVQQEVIKSYYYENKTFAECGKMLNVSTERARQIQAKSIRKLRGNKDIQRLGDELGYTSKALYSDTYGSFRRTGMTQLERIAIERAYISENISRKLIELHERNKLLQEKF